MNNFRRKILKVDGPRIHKIKNSYGVYDAYKYIRKNKWFNIGQNLTEHQFYYIIRTINNYLVDSLIRGKDIKLPCRMGSIEVRKKENSPFVKDNKVKSYAPVDWDRTLKLWSEDENAYKERTLVKTEDKEVFKIWYNKTKANYNNQSFYEFKANRDLKLRLKKRIKNGNFDAFII